MILTLAASLLHTFAPAQTASTTTTPVHIDCAATVAKENRESALARFKVGEKAIESSKWTEAETALVKAVAFDNTLAIAHYGLGQTYMSLQRFPEAVRSFTLAREAFRCFPLSAEDRKRRRDAIVERREAVRTLDQRRIREVVNSPAAAR